MRKLVQLIFIFLISTSASADENELINIKKISEISKNLVNKQKNVGINDLMVDFITTMASPRADFVQVEVHLHQISSKKELLPEEIEKLIPKETKPELYNHYKMTTFTVNFSSNEISKGIVTKGIGTTDEIKKP